LYVSIEIIQPPSSSWRREYSSGFMIEVRSTAAIAGLAA
jgi:hypothetical protein